MATGLKPHVAHFEWCEGATFITVDCPDDDLGDKRPCAVWGAEYDDGTREDECVLRQYAEALGADEFLFGTVKCDVQITGAGYGEDFHGEVI